MKKQIKTVLALLLVSVLLLFSLAGCATGEESDTESVPEQAEPTEPVTVNLGGLKGPTTMGMVKLLADAEEGLTENRYRFTMAVTADELTPQFLKGELDILAVPANLASILANNSGGEIEVIAVNTLGVLYLVEKGGDTVQTVEDLKGKTILATGKGTTPEYALSYLLAEHGLDITSDVTVEWKSEPSEIVAQMATMDSAVAMMPQPFVTVASMQVEGLRTALDLTAEWDALGSGSRLVTSVLAVRRAFADEHPDTVAAFLRDYAASVEYVNENPEEAGALIESYGIVKAAVAARAIPYCNLVCLTGDDMKTAVSGYLSVLAKQNPKSIGSQMPSDDFYRTGE